jgi:hypothetical protein
MSQLKSIKKINMGQLKSKSLRRISTAISTALLLTSGSAANAGGTDTYLFVNNSGVPLYYWVFNHGWKVGSEATARYTEGVKHVYYIPRCSMYLRSHQNWQNRGFPPTVKISLAIPTGKVQIEHSQIEHSSGSEHSSENGLSADVQGEIEGVGRGAEAAAQASYKKGDSYKNDSNWSFSIGGEVIPSPFLFDPTTATWNPGNRKLIDKEGKDYSWVVDDGYSMYYMAPTVVPGFESHTCGTLSLSGLDGKRFSWNSNFLKAYMTGGKK